MTEPPAVRSVWKQRLLELAVTAGMVCLAVLVWPRLWPDAAAVSHLMGATPEQVEAELGRPNKVWDRPENITRWRYVRRGLVFEMPLFLEFQNGVVIRVDAASPR